MRMVRRIMLAALALLTSGCTTTIGKKKAEPTDWERVFAAAESQLQTGNTARPEKQPLVLAHYMPWYQAPPTSAQYGLHWHQGSAAFDPYENLSDGRANIASHQYPLTGPYDSADPKVLEYQTALMKLSGIDGVIFDWYGVADGLDYKVVHTATLAMIDALKKAGLKYAVCYEDQSVTHLIDFGIIEKEDALNTARDTFLWMGKNWFNDPAYVRVEGRPLVFCFGPQRFNQKAEWDAIFAGLPERPFFLDLDNKTSWADASYNWPPMWKSSAGKLSIPSLVNYLNDFYRKQAAGPFLAATVFPAFHDIYAQVGGKSYGYLDWAEGRTFRLTWEAAMLARPDIIQIATWNDYGEGTIVEPTIERGYRELEFIQDERKKWDENFSYTYMDLRIPIELYKKAAGNPGENEIAAIEKTYTALFAGEADAFRDAARAAGLEYDFSLRPLLGEPGAGQTETVMVFDAAGKKNLSLGKPVEASSKIDVWLASKAVDGDTATYWEGAANKYPGVLTVDLGNPAAITTVVMRLNPLKIWGKRTQRIEVLVSDDGAEWRQALPAADYLFDPAANGNTVVITVSERARYVRLAVTANSGATNGQIAELEVYGE